MNKQIKNNISKIRNDFPILKTKVNNQKLIYFDNAATTQKPKSVIDELTSYYSKYNSNVHRGIHTLSEISTSKFEETRIKVAKFINSDSKEIVFTTGTTDSINIIVNGIKNKLKKDDEIILTDFEHHANLIPWQELAKELKLNLKFATITKDYQFDFESFNKLITKKTKIISISHISNVLGTILPIEKICAIAKKNNIITVIDAAQSIGHTKIDVKKIKCDFLVFSAHKMLGPTGVGVIYGRYKILDSLNPSKFGGSMISEVKLKTSTYNKTPYKFEAGTPNFADIIAFTQAIEYINKIGIENIEIYDEQLTEYFLENIKKLKGFNLIGPIKNRAPVFTFTLKYLDSYDISTLLDQYGIAIRSGQHCAMTLNKKLKINSSSRASLYFYNSFKEIDYFFDSLKRIEKKFYKESK